MRIEAYSPKKRSITHAEESEFNLAGERGARPAKSLNPGAWRLGDALVPAFAMPWNQVI